MDPATLSHREELARAFPALDGHFTRLTGLLREEQTLPERTKLGRTLEAFAMFSGGVACGVAALALGPAGLPMALVGCAATVAGSRDLQLPTRLEDGRFRVGEYPRAHHDVLSGPHEWPQSGRVSDAGPRPR